MKMKALATWLILVLLCGGIAPSMAYARKRRPVQMTCSRPPVRPIRNNHILVVINYNYSYNAKDPASGRTWLKSTILRRLNDLGRPDGNTFEEPNGQPPNFHMTFTLNNDGQEHFTGYVELSGWGWGHVATEYLNQYSYSNPAQLTTELTDKAYSYIHTGWHEHGCPE